MEGINAQFLPGERHEIASVTKWDMKNRAAVEEIPALVEDAKDDPAVHRKLKYRRADCKP